MIKSGKDTPLYQVSGTVPDVSGALDGWKQKITVTRIVKSVVNFEVVETRQEISFSGVWQLLSPAQLLMKPPGQRDWKWFQIHSDTSLGLRNDEVVEYKGIKYRVKSVADYSLYGYFQYDLIEDYDAD